MKKQVKKKLVNKNALVIEKFFKLEDYGKNN